MTAALATGHPNPRGARAERTRTAVVDALLALLREGRRRPTGREIADRAGVSLRSLYVHFEDLDDLYRAAAAHQLRRHRHLVEPIDPRLPLDERVRCFVRRRARLYEATDGVRQAASFWAPTSPALTEVVATAHRAGWQEVTRVFAAELAGDEARTHAVWAASSDALWDGLRHIRGLGVAEARRVMELLVRAALAPPDA